VERSHFELAAHRILPGIGRPLQLPGLVLGEVAADLLALVQHHAHFWKLSGESGQDFRQHVARLRVRRGDGKRPRVLATELIGDALHVGNLAERPSRRCDDDFTRRRKRCQTFALANEDAQTELVLELPNLLADAGLRRIQRDRSVGNVQPVVDDRAQIFELLQVHDRI